MSNVSIYGKNWIDLVFEGRNKAYGAYQLRQQNEKTTITAFFFALLFLFLISGMGLLLSAFGSKPVVEIPIDDPTIIVTTYHLPKHQPQKAIPPVSKPQKKTDEKDLLNPTIVPNSDTPDDIKDNAAIDANTDNAAAGTGDGQSLKPGEPDVPSTGTAVIPTIPDDTPVKTTALDVMPEFPGGIKKFYDYVGRNFERPEVELSQKINVLMYFVIEKDGGMSDIKVLRNPGYGLDKEAIRVLKSLRTKWKPGIKDGQPVRTAYTLPIAVQPL